MATGAPDAWSRRAICTAAAPTAALLVRASSFGDGSDGTLHGGEDVDFVWRLTRAGLHVRYEPAGEVEHEHRTSLAGFVSRRVYYGRTAAPLAKQHSGTARPLAVSPWTAVAWAAVALGRPLLDGAITGIASGLLAFQLRDVVKQPVREAARLAAGGTFRSGEVMADACVRAWWPLAIPAFAAVPRLRPALVAASLLPPLLTLCGPISTGGFA
jgi:mycofactocin glycosyltransferase